MPPQNDFHTVTFILAIGAAVGPVVFGFMIFKAGQFFVSRSTFEDYRKSQDETRLRMEKTLESIQHDVSKLLQRTAKHAAGDED